MKNISVRKALESDVSLVFQWRNEPEIVALSDKQVNVSWNEHEVWFKKKINCILSDFLIIDVDQEPVGVIRFDPVENNATIYDVSIYLMGRNKGKNIGSIAMKKAMHELVNQRNICALHARIRCENRISIKFFESLGFNFLHTDGNIDLYIYEVV